MAEVLKQMAFGDFCWRNGSNSKVVGIVLPLRMKFVVRLCDYHFPKFSGKKVLWVLCHATNTFVVMNSTFARPPGSLAAKCQQKVATRLKSFSDKGMLIPSEFWPDQTKL
jgi:hypothetical protein